MKNLVNSKILLFATITILITSLALVFKCYSSKKVNNKEELKVFIVIPNIPYDFINSKNQYEGFDIDIHKSLFKDFNVKYIEGTDDARIPSLESGKADIVASSVTVNEERKKKVDFIGEIIKAPGNAFAKLKGSKVNYKDAGLKVGVIKGTSSAEYAIDNYKDKEIVIFDSDDMAYQALKLKKVDLIYLDSAQLRALGIFSNENKIDIIQESKVKSKKVYSYAIKKGNKELYDKLSKRLNEMRDSGEIEKISKKWF